jgi:ABC-type branched-subunit amino acid transport system substrate-binding protein
LARDTLDGLRLALGSESAQQPDAAELAGLDFDPEPGREKRAPPRSPGVPSFELIVKDTGNNPQTAAQAVEALARTEGVIAIVGPLARAESEAAAVRAEELGVPLVSLSLSLDLPQGGQYVFRNSKSQEEEVHDLVLYAMDYFQARRFAVLYPANAYGDRLLQLFWEEVRKNGGILTAASAFTPWNVKAQKGEKEPVGLKQIFETFVGQDRPLRPKDRALLEAVGDSRPDAVVDFDALFIPLGQDAGQELRLIAPYPVTVDAEHVLLLGTRFWNEDAVLVAGGSKLEGSLFADVYDRSGSAPRVVAFLSKHRAWYGQRPRYAAPSYYSAIGYDTLNLLMNQLREPRLRTRESLARGLKASPPYPGVTGLTSFRASGEAEKETMFFRIRGGEFVRQLH